MIVIIGAGLSGLTLACILRTKSIPFQIYDADASATSRPQGGSLDLKPDSGQRALKVAGLFEVWKSKARADNSEDTRIVDKDGKVHYVEIGEQDTREEAFHPEIDRGQLRDLLLDGLEVGTVQWGHKLVAVLKEDVGYLCKFANGAQVTGSLVVGADGAWSVVRRTLSSALPVYSGLSFYDLTIRNIKQKPESLQELVGNGIAFVLGDRQGIIAQHNANDVVRVYAALRVPEENLKAMETAVLDGDKIKAELVGETGPYAKWSQEVKELVVQANSEPIRFWPIRALPIGFQWDATPGITLIGDAAHLMSPFAGEGANLAMADAADLAEALASKDSAAIRKFEETMFARAEECAQESSDNLELFFGDNAAAAATKIFQSHHGPPPE